MKKLLFVFVLGAFAACGGNEGSEATTDSTSMSTDTSTMSSGAMGTDTAGSAGTSTDTTMRAKDNSRMGADTGATTTPH